VGPRFSILEHIFALPVDWPHPRGLRDQLEYIDSKGVLSHPFMSRRCTNMHEDSSNTDVSAEPGPPADTIGGAPPAYIRWVPPDDAEPKLGIIPTLGFSSEGGVVGIGVRPQVTKRWGLIGRRRVGRWFRGIFMPSTGTGLRVWSRRQYHLLVLDPTTGAIVRQIALPEGPVRYRAITTRDLIHIGLGIDRLNYMWRFFVQQPGEEFGDSAGGAYFVIDNQDRAIVPTTRAEV
jgi:hypothetical protein